MDIKIIDPSEADLRSVKNSDFGVASRRALRDPLRLSSAGTRPIKTSFLDVGPRRGASDDTAKRRRGERT